MAILRALNEFVKESTVIALEPARECISSCTYCFAHLNSSSQYKNKQKSLEDKSTFESIITKAYSPSYDPTHFLQWAMKNRLSVGYANTVEPFQDAEQANNLLTILDKFKIPLFIQTKGYNFDLVWDRLKPFHDNANLFLSFPTDNEDIIKRFEIKTPPASERFRIIEKATDAGFHVTLALSPFHDEWIGNPIPFISKAHKLGIRSIFFDPLHLNISQRESAKDKAMVKLALRTENAEFSDNMLSKLQSIYEYSLENDIPFFASGLIPTIFGFPNTIPTITPPGVFSRGLAWPYNDGVIFEILQSLFFDDPEYDPANRDFNDSLIVKWQDVLAIMESNHKIDQEFSWSSLRDLIAIKTIPAPWQNVLKPVSHISEYYRAFWNSPHSRQFCWRHPWSKIAVKQDGSPWTDEGGNAIMIFDPDYVDTRKNRTVESLDEYRNFTRT